jgi:hypothetical protein
MATLSLEQRLDLAKAALLAAEKNAQDVTKNAAYWNSQVEQEKKLVESLQLEIQEAKP